MTNEIYPNEKIPRLSGSMKTKTVSMFPIFLQQGCNLVNPTSVCRFWCWLRPGSWPSRLLRTSKTLPRSWPSPVSMEAHRTTLRVSLKKKHFLVLFSSSLVLITPILPLLSSRFYSQRHRYPGWNPGSYQGPHPEQQTWPDQTQTRCSGWSGPNVRHGICRTGWRDSGLIVQKRYNSVCCKK